MAILIVRGLLLASSVGTEAKMLLNILQCLGQPHHKEQPSAKC